MPTNADGEFEPTPWQPFRPGDRLFGVTLANERDYSDTVESRATEAMDVQWDQFLRHTTALAVRCVVDGVHANYQTGRAVRFQGVRLGMLRAYCRTISEVLLDSELSPGRVGDEINRLVKTFGLVTYDLAPGERHNWPMAPRLISLDQALDFVDAALRGRWPEPVSATAEHDPMALVS